MRMTALTTSRSVRLRPDEAPIGGAELHRGGLVLGEAFRPPDGALMADSLERLVAMSRGGQRCGQGEGGDNGNALHPRTLTQEAGHENEQ